MKDAELIDIENRVDMLAKAGQMNLALPLLRTLVAQVPQEPRHRLNLAFSLIDSGRALEALDQLDQLPKSLFDQALPWLAQGLAHLALESYERAISVLRAALQRDPAMHIAAILTARAQLVTGDALGATKTLLQVPFEELEADDAAELVTCLLALHRYQEALEIVERNLSSTSTHAILLLRLAQLKERSGQFGEAEAALEKIASPTIDARILGARIQARKGFIEGAIFALQDLKAHAEEMAGTIEVASLEFELGKWLDSVGRYEESWFAYSAANQIDKGRHLRIFPERYRAAAEASFFLDSHSLDSVPKSTNGNLEPSPLFIIGFPRSGTTLLDNLLDMHPDLLVLDEKPLLEPAMLSVAGMSKGYPMALADLGETDFIELRRLYRDQVRQFSKPKPGARVVDKNPFNLLRVPLIRRLFPNARWLFSIRHPLDVVISCFMQRFDFTELTRGFCDLSEIIDVYERSMTLWLNQRERLELDCIDVRYEELVRDQNASSRALLKKLELPWVDSVLDFDQGAAKRWISTPSYDQVTRSIYSGSVNRWRNYLPWLAPAISSLSPLIERLGYDSVEVTQ